MKRSERLIPRLRQFFRDNPDEILSFDDIAAKFECSRLKARAACKHLREEGTVQTMVVAMASQERKRA